METRRFDFVILGSGLAGLYSAAYASKFGKVALLTKSTFEVSNSYWAQGGIAAAMDPDDSPDYHFNDTIEAGRRLCDKEAVKILVNEGKDRIEDLMKMGMKFDYENGILALGLEGGHSRRRVLHAGGDSTGREIVNFLIRYIIDLKNIAIFENTLVYELISDGSCCFGVHAHDFRKNSNITLESNATIIAAGGASGIFQRTTNPHTTTGDGIVLAYNIGAEVADMEFIQFHPTALCVESKEAFLISEAVRGEGAHLVNDEGERFLFKYDEKGELAPRDVVSRAIFEELKLRGKNKVFLKLDHLDANKIKKRFSNIYQEILRYGINILKDPVPVAPAAHYMIGGIKTGLMAETNIKRLFACGETAAIGVHGANRLASNSLLECVVFGKRGIDAALQTKLNMTSQDIPPAEFVIDKSNEEFYLDRSNKLAVVMTNYTGIVRCKKSLTKALNRIEEITLEIESRNNDYYSSRLRSLTDVCKLIVNSALLRKESRGSQIREDFPDESPQFLKHIIQQKNNVPQYQELS